MEVECNMRVGLLYHLDNEQLKYHFSYILPRLHVKDTFITKIYLCKLYLTCSDNLKRLLSEKFLTLLDYFQTNFIQL